ncbi:hypothetical protein [Haloferula sp.]|uniref:hypothetical protein n=1 Tax=Haloferula sp. TaxID=2497595 RepID=UPI00329D73BD
MKLKALCLLTTLLGCGSLAAEPLSPADSQALLAELDALRNTARTNAVGRLEGAGAAFTTGMASDKAALELYLNSVEKVDFIDRDRKSSAFREWKNRNKNLDNKTFGIALRQQLRWTVLTIQASTDRENMQALAGQMMEILDSIYSMPEELRDHTDTLSESVSRTVFARAYELNGYKLEDWPMSPLSRSDGKNPKVKVDEPFKLIIFPALEEKRDFVGLRAAWKKRIDFEEIALGFWSPGSKDVENGQSPERDRFLSEALPELEWEREEHLFKAGDEKTAAVKMLQHVRDNISHPKARDWESRFRALVTPKNDAETAGNSDAG